MEKFSKEFRIGELLFKQRIENLSPVEEIELNAWLEKDRRNELFANDLLSDEDLAEQISTRKNIRTNLALQNVNEKIDSSKSRRLVLNILKYAAIVFLPIAAFWFANSTYNQSVIVQETLIEPGCPKAVLMLADGSSVDLGDQKNKSIRFGNEVVAENVNDNLIYRQLNEDNLEQNLIEKFNTLLTPLKGEYSTTLSDGTKIWMNSLSSLRYPIQFAKNERKVYLSGEAYFEVAKNELKPFYVVLETGMEIRVLGTKFNIMSYGDEDLVETTLLEGKVQVITKNANGCEQKNILIPNQQLSFNKESKKSEVKSVDASIYAAWKNGLFTFENEKLGVFMRKLERWYGCDIVYENEELRNISFTGEIKKYENFSSVLKILKLTEDIDFAVKGNVVYIKKELK
ncbi:MAG: FecR family protein [Labilibaculum antarcticum]